MSGARAPSCASAANIAPVEARVLVAAEAVQEHEQRPRPRSCSPAGTTAATGIVACTSGLAIVNVTTRAPSLSVPCARVTSTTASAATITAASALERRTMPPS